MSDATQKAQLYIEEDNFKEALKLARKRHGKDDVESYLSILDLLIDKDYLPALEEKGMYYQYYDQNHDNGDYGEKYFDEYLEKQPKSINVLCDKAMSKFNKGKTDESLSIWTGPWTNTRHIQKLKSPAYLKRTYHGKN